MRVRLSIVSDENNEVINVDAVKNKNAFAYRDTYDAECICFVYRDGVIIKRKSEDHETKVVLREPCFVEVSSSLGILKFDVKRLAFEVNNDNIFIAYTVNDMKTVIRIEYFVGGN